MARRMTAHTALPDPTAPLSDSDASAAFAAILDGTVSDEAIAAFLIALAERGETATEIAAAAWQMRQRLIPISAPAGAIDVCGTGGDGHHTLNVSTAVSLVVAACGVPVAKHGNRAASSKAGAADTLEALGLDLDRVAQTAERSLADIGICFLFAQKHHPALARIGPLRRAIGRRTIFNLMGPLANPAGVKRQLIGIARPAYVPIYAQALSQLGIERAMVISGDEGLDELSLAGGNDVADVTADGLVAMRRVSAADAGLPSHPIEAIRGGDPAHNAAALRALLMGEHGAYRDAVLLNAAAALVIAGEAGTLREGAEEAAEIIDKGLAKTLLDCWIAYS
jgi:anthranilate phosphoribosyltransferase